MRRGRSYRTDSIVREYERKKLYAKRKGQECIVDERRNCNDCIYNEICEERYRK